MTFVILELRLGAWDDGPMMEKPGAKATETYIEVADRLKKAMDLAMNEALVLGPNDVCKLTESIIDKWANDNRATDYGSAFRKVV